jgi:hypothetical protein
MIFGKNKKPVKADESSAPAKTRPSRYNCTAMVSINGFEGQAALRNISMEGFRITSRTYAVLKQRDEYTMIISPIGMPGMDSFQIRVEVRWIRSTETTFSAGLAIVKSPDGNRAWENYVNYIKANGARAV